MIHTLFSQKGKPFLTGFLASIFSLLLGTYTPLFANGIDTYINHKLSPISNCLAGIIFFTVPIGGTDVPLIVGWLILAAIILTFYFRGIQFRGFWHGIDILRGRYYNPKDDGEVSPFQALSTALSGTVGLGNIAGVAVALSIGGPGATLWMVIAGFMGMATKFTECTLGVKYRTRYTDGHVSGGPMYYLSKGFAEKGMPKIGKGFATASLTLSIPKV
jgi:AGCS family alanine or glycine:cation symporter